MFKSGYILDTEEKLKAAMFNKSDVIVRKRGKIDNYGGPIENVTREAVMINGGTFLKDFYEFRIR
jgi:hypothetical protein